MNAASQTPGRVGGDPDRETNADTLAAVLKATADPLRLQILRVLSNNAFGALELSEIFAMRQNAMSHHLKVLSKAGFVNSRREGTHIFYRRESRAGDYASLRAAIFAEAGGIALPEEILLRFESIQEARSAASRDFFSANARKFREQQDLIASYPQYGEAVLSTLDSYAPLNDKAVLEVGPGEGELLPGLCDRFSTVIALDNSPDMLDRARAHAAARGANVDCFVLGDSSGSENLKGIEVDAITLNMVLHHTPAPAVIIQNLAGHLKPGGVIVITELCHHDQDWVREACGDLWLGFEPEELHQWAAAAGLKEIGSEFLALKNGFSIQIQQFCKP